MRPLSQDALTLNARVFCRSGWGLPFGAYKKATTTSSIAASMWRLCTPIGSRAALATNDGLRVAGEDPRHGGLDSF